MNATGTGTITNQYGLYITNMTKGANNNYSIYSAGGQSYFAGSVGIGDTTPASLLTVGDGDLFQVNSTGAIVASTGITSTGNATISTAINSTNTFGSGASSINTIGSVTTPGLLTLHGATSLDNTFTVSGANLTSLGGNLTVTGTAWTATPTISGLITATLGLTATTGNITATAGDVAITAGLLSLNGVTRISNAGIGTFITGTVIGTQTFTTNNIADSGALTINSGTTGALTLDSGTTGSILIGTNVNAKIITIGNGVDDTLTINSSGFKATSAGALSGITTIGMNNQLTSTLATGTSPFAVTSTTLNTNLNADLLDGQHGNYYATAAGYIPYTGGTTNVDLGIHNLTVDANSLFVDSGTHRVGVGTTAPGAGYILDVNGNTYLRGYLVASETSWGLNLMDNVPLTLGGSAVSSIGTDGTKSYWSVGTSIGSATGITMDSSGNVGIGTTGPTRQLVVSSAGNTVIQVDGNLLTTSRPQLQAVGDTGTFSFVQNGSATGNTNFNNVPATGVLTESDTGGLVVATSAVAPIIFATGGMTFSNERMRITSTGNFGIGTTAPLSKLAINGGLHVGGESDAGDNNILADGTITGTQLFSNIATGTSPLSVTSTTAVTNLNADMLDGQHASAFASSALNPVSIYNSSSTTALIATSIAANNYSLFHGTIKIVDFNGGRNSTINISGTLLNTGVISMNYTTANGVAYPVNLFNYNGYLYVSVSGLSIYSTIEAYITSEAYQNYNGLNTVTAVTMDPKPSSGVTNDLAITPISITTGVGTTNYIPKFTGTSAFGNSLIYDNGTSVGIGTTGPGTKLSVAGNVTIGDGTGQANIYLNRSVTNTVENAIRWQTNGVNDWYLGSGATAGNSDWQLYNYGTSSSALTILRSNGNVGIGTTNPLWKLDVKEATAGTAASFNLENTDNTNTASHARIRMVTGPNGGDTKILMDDGGASVWNFGVDNSDSDKFKFSANADGLLETSTLLTLQTNGNVGIGTTGPSGLLDIYRATDNTGLKIQTGAYGGGYLTIFGEDKNLAGVASSYDHTERFNMKTTNMNGGAGADRTMMAIHREGWSDGDELVLLPSGGNVGIGTTAPGKLLQVEGSNGNQILVKSGNTSWTAGIELDTGSANADWTIASSGGSPGLFQIQNVDQGGTPPFNINLGNVGIGTVTPSAKLDVAGMIHAGASYGLNLDQQDAAGDAFITHNSYYSSGYESNALKLKWGNTHASFGSRGIILSYIDGINFYADAAAATANTEFTPSIRMTIKNDGNVGIGTTGPGAKLDILSQEGSDTVFLRAGKIGASTENTFWGFNVNGNNNAYIGSAYNAADNRFGIRVAGTDVAHEWVSVLGTGSVGIGTTTPAAKLDVNGTINASSISSTGPVTSLGTYSGSALFYINGSSVATSPAFIASHSLATTTNGTAGLVLANNTYAPGVYSPIIAFSSKTSSGTYNASYASIYGILEGAGGDSNWNKGNLIFATGDSYGTSERMRISYDGSVGISNLVSCGGIQTNGAGTMSCTSDARLKDIKEDFTLGLNAIMQINPQTYSWKTDSGLYDGGIDYSGFIAQNVETAIPEAVNINPSGNRQVNTTTILAASVNAIKELNLKLEGINKFEVDGAGQAIVNTLRDNLTAWLANAGNKITRIFTGEVCLTDPGQEAVCINRSELQSLKALIIDSNSDGNNGGNEVTPTLEEIEAARVAKIDTDLTTAKTTIAAKVEADYTADSWLLFTPARDSALLLPEVVESQTPAQTGAELEANKTAKTAALNDAMALLISNNQPSDISALTTAKGIAQGLIDASAIESVIPGEHIVGSLATLITANAAATGATTDTQDVIDAQVTTLNDAITAYNAAIVPAQN